MGGEKHIAFLGLGSNLVSGASENIEKAIEELNFAGQIMNVSAIYTTRPVNALSPCEADYHNAVVKLSTAMPMDDLQASLKSIESKMGRERTKGSVVIDLDLVMWDCSVVRPRDFERDYFQIGYQQIVK